MSKKKPRATKRENAPRTNAEDQWVIAAAYQSDRIRAAASAVAGWSAIYLKHKQSGTRVRDHAAFQFTVSVISLGSIVIWNEVPFGLVGWMARAGAASALALDLLESMPRVLASAVSLRGEVKPQLIEPEECADRYATLKTIEICRQIMTISPKLFEGSDGPTRRVRARLAWRQIHNVTEPAPLSLPEKTRKALDATGSLVTEAEAEDPAPDPLTSAGKALAAAFELRKEGKPVSLKAACDRAKVDRKNIRKRHPDILAFIKALAAADRSPPRMTRDRRTGNFDAVDEDDE